MRAAVYRVPGRHHQAHADAMAAGLARHGIETITFGFMPDPTADFCTVWGWRVGERIRAGGYDKPILVMERGYIGDRWQWTSLGWDGLNGRARWNAAHDSGERFWRNFGHLACEWERHDGYALILGQVEGDMALRGVHFGAWATTCVAALKEQGRDVRFRPHPEAIKRGQKLPVPPHLHLDRTLQDALSSAAFVVTWNSNTSTDAVLSGVPAIAMDQGAMAWPMASHAIDDDLVTPDRTEWFRDMAWRQWSTNEMSDGSAWEVVREAM